MKWVRAKRGPQARRSFTSVRVFVFALKKISSFTLYLTTEVITQARVVPVSSDEDDGGGDSDSDSGKKLNAKGKKKKTATWVREGIFFLCTFHRPVLWAGISRKGALFELPQIFVTF